MSVFLPVIRMGLMVAPIVIIGLTIPFIFRSYHQYGHISITQWLIVISFGVYLFMVFAFTIFPLPPIEEVADMTKPTMQLVPFYSVQEFLTKSGFVWNDLSTYVPAMRSWTFLEPMFNIVMFIPLGIYLRYYFGRTWWEVILMSFSLSLLLEVIQLTGLFWIYPRPYRLFDVDDLIANTIGGWLGYIICPILTWWLPTKKELLTHNYQKGKTVGYFRRLMAFMLDWFLIGCFILIVKAMWKMLNVPPLAIPGELQVVYTYIGIIIGYFILLPAIARGRTIGKWIVQIAISSRNHRGVKLFSVFIRQVLLYGLFLPCLLIVIYYFLNFNTTFGAINPNQIDPVALVRLLVPTVITIIFLMDIVYKRVRGKESPVLLYENLSKTEEVNTIVKPRQVV